MRNLHQGGCDLHLLPNIVGQSAGGSDGLLQGRRILPHPPRSVFRLPDFAHNRLHCMISMAWYTMELSRRTIKWCSARGFECLPCKIKVDAEVLDPNCELLTIRRGGTKPS